MEKYNGFDSEEQYRTVFDGIVSRMGDDYKKLGTFMLTRRGDSVLVWTDGFVAVMDVNVPGTGTTVKVDKCRDARWELGVVNAIVRDWPGLDADS